MLLIPALGRQREADFREFEASLVTRRVSGQPGLYTEKLCLEKQNKQTNKKRGIRNYDKESDKYNSQFTKGLNQVSAQRNLEKETLNIRNYTRQQRCGTEKHKAAVTLPPREALASSVGFTWHWTRRGLAISAEGQALRGGARFQPCV